MTSAADDQGLPTNSRNSLLIFLWNQSENCRHLSRVSPLVCTTVHWWNMWQLQEYKRERRARQRRQRHRCFRPSDTREINAIIAALHIHPYMSIHPPYIHTGTNISRKALLQRRATAAYLIIAELVLLQQALTSHPDNLRHRTAYRRQEPRLSYGWTDNLRPQKKCYKKERTSPC